jgi:hypothetical protein
MRGCCTITSAFFFMEGVQVSGLQRIVLVESVLEFHSLVLYLSE